MTCALLNYYVNELQMKRFVVLIRLITNAKQLRIAAINALINVIGIELLNFIRMRTLSKLIGNYVGALS